MNFVLGFAPFIAFFVLMRTVSVQVGVWTAAAFALLTAVRDLTRQRPLKVLEVGSVLLFGATALLTSFTHIDWTVGKVRLLVDGGLLMIVLVSLAIGRPFTLPYARERVSAEYWNSPLFLSINRAITWVWAAAFAVMSAADAAAVYVPQIPLWIDIAATLAALGTAITFTLRYPEQARRRATNAPTRTTSASEG